MMLLQPQVSLLDKFVIQQESIPNLISPIGFKHGQILIPNRNSTGVASVGGTGDAIDALNKNVSLYSQQLSN